MGLPEFNAALTRAVDESGKNQSEIARDTDGLVSQGTISTWLSGNARPQPEGVFAVELALDLPPGSLSRHLGYVPYVEDPVIDLRDAIDTDDTLDEFDREALRMLYNVMRRRSAASKTVSEAPASKARNRSTRSLRS